MISGTLTVPVESVETAVALAGFVVPGVQLQRRHVHQGGLDQREHHGQADERCWQDELQGELTVVILLDIKCPVNCYMSARIGYTTEGTLFISAQLSTDTASALCKVWVVTGLWEQHSIHHASKHEVRLPRVKKRVPPQFK